MCQPATEGENLEFKQLLFICSSFENRIKAAENSLSTDQKGGIDLKLIQTPNEKILPAQLN
jgi:hypothetical protein